MDKRTNYKTKQKTKTGQVIKLKYTKTVYPAAIKQIWRRQV